MSKEKVNLFVLILVAFFCVDAFASELKGVVKTEKGDPLAGVFIFYGRSMRDLALTDERGAFSVSIGSKVMFFRREGFRPLTKIVDSVSQNLEIILVHEATSEAAVPKCQADKLSGKRIGHSIRLLVPKDAKTSEGFDVDYGYFSIGMRSGNQQVRLQGIYGPMATLGIPPEEWILDAVEFSERSYKDNGLFTDIRGKAKDGTHWRYIGSIGESIQYKDLKEQEAKYFDKIIDTACY